MCLDLSGSSVLTVGGANTYTGGTTITSGLLNVTNSDSLPDGSSLDGRGRRDPDLRPRRNVIRRRRDASAARPGGDA